MNSALLELHPASILLPLGLCKWRKELINKTWRAALPSPFKLAAHFSSWLTIFNEPEPLSSSLHQQSAIHFMQQYLKYLVTCWTKHVNFAHRPSRFPCVPTSLRHLSTSHLHSSSQTQSYAINSLHLFKCSLHLKAMVMYSQCLQPVLCTCEQIWRHEITM